MSRSFHRLAQPMSSAGCVPDLGTSPGFSVAVSTGRGGHCREAYLSAKRPKAFQASRIPPSHGRSCRPGRHQVSAPQGPRPVVGLIRSLSSRSAFDALHRDARRVRQGPIWVRYLPGPDGPAAEVAFAIGRRIGNAVVRNRLRRRMRAILTELDQAARLPPGVYLFGAAPGAERLTFDDLRMRMQHAIRKAAEATP